MSEHDVLWRVSSPFFRQIDLWPAAIIKEELEIISKQSSGPETKLINPKKLSLGD